MDFTYLVNILLRRKWLLLSVTLLATAATWYFIGQLPPVYKAKSVISTGIIDYKGLTLEKDNPFIQKFQIESSFSGLIEKMKSRSSIKPLTDKLLAHDLLADSGSQKPFREPDDEELELTKSEIDDIVLKLKTNHTDTLLNKGPQVAQPNTQLAEAYEYDYESLSKNLKVERIGETDFLNVEFDSESPELSYFVIYHFLSSFFEQHEEDLSREENQALSFNIQQLQQRRAELDSITNEINNYKKANGLVDVSTQRESVISQIKDLESKLEEKRQLIPTLVGQIKSLEAQISKYNRTSGDYISSKVIHNEDFERLDREIKELYDQHIESIAAGNKESGLEQRIESLKQQRAVSIQRSIGAITSKEEDRIANQVNNWIADRLDKQLELQYARIASNSYNQALGNLRGRADNLLINDNYLNSLESEKERLENEYSKVRIEYDNNKLYAEGTENPLKIVEPVEMPNEPESNNRLAFSAFAGVAGGSLASIFLFLLAFMDTSIQSPSQFQRVTKLPLQGYVNKVKVKNMNLQSLFSHTQKKGELEFFKENVRKLRTAFENSDAKSFLFVSPKEQEGKSFLIVLLAYALSLNNRKVLIIDTNFKNNTLSGFKTKSFIEITTGHPSSLKTKGLGTGRKALPPGPDEGPSDPHLKNIDIVGNKGGSQSPSEILAGKDFKKVMESYAKKYDFIFLEAAAMNKYSDARELMPFAEKVAVVFSSESPIGNADKDTLQYLSSMNGKMFGGILNNVDLKNI